MGNEPEVDLLKNDLLWLAYYEMIPAWGGVNFCQPGDDFEWLVEMVLGSS